MQLIRITNENRTSCISFLGKTEYLIAATVAIVGGGEDGHHISIMRPVVALHHQLVSPEMLLPVLILHVKVIRFVPCDQGQPV